jgi:hypothetical protein
VVTSKLNRYVKNLVGWSTKRKIIVFAVDDYGNIRMASRDARERLRMAGLPVDNNRFDKFDSLETADDLAALYDTLSSVKDTHDNPFVFTAYALPANIDFERMEKENYSEFRFELLPHTLNRLPGHEGTWRLWLEGIEKQMLVPQFHGREHVNLKVLMELLTERDPQLMACFRERSFGALTTVRYPTIAYVSAFEFDKVEENRALATIALEGLELFHKVFGRTATNFNAPGAPAHQILEKTLARGGVKYIDAPFIKKEHQGGGKYTYRFNYLGKRNQYGQRYMVRNCVFEPLIDRNDDNVERCLAEIEAAFSFGKPAIVSSHRVNFCGHIDRSVRDHGLIALKKLLSKVKQRWPDVEAMSADKLGDLISANHN